MNPYQHLVSEYARFAREGKTFPLGNFPALPRPELPPYAPKVLIFSPHPDDECIIGGLALRLLREAGMNVINVAVTQGSKRERQAERWREVEGACGYLGFGLVATKTNGLLNLNTDARKDDPARWVQAMNITADLLTQHRPRCIFYPHELDWNSTHIGTHLLLTDSLARMPKDFTCHVVETEFWGQMQSPNLMVESSAADVADLVTALTFHAGEVRRNPYHLSLPAWMIDNVRRGAELVGGQGGEAPEFTFATLYRWRKWAQGKLEKVFDGGRLLGRADKLVELFN
ncbi:MAG: PIG-L family deacetylase [Verrucomicrobia bacterium]|nr:PIG-L family deacetylase [Verrucomicrobiota bacterium]